MQRERLTSYEDGETCRGREGRVLRMKRHAEGKKADFLRMKRHAEVKTVELLRMKRY